MLHQRELFCSIFAMRLMQQLLPEPSKGTTPPCMGNVVNTLRSNRMRCTVAAGIPEAQLMQLTSMPLVVAPGTGRHILKERPIMRRACCDRRLMLERTGSTLLIYTLRNPLLYVPFSQVARHA